MDRDKALSIQWGNGSQDFNLASAFFRSPGGRISRAASWQLEL